jgi:hypothetical protein
MGAFRECIASQMLKNSQGISENEELIGMGISIIQNAHMILDRYPPDTTEHQTQNKKENRVQALRLVKPSDSSGSS